MVDPFMLSSALLIGVFGSTHCALMCGGIAIGLSRQEPELWHNLSMHIGRILGYGLAGLIASSLVHTLVRFTFWPALGTSLRALAGLVLLLAALRIAAPASRWIPKRWLAWSASIGQRGWTAMAPWRHRMHSLTPKTPAARWARALIIGALWGWMPCGLSLTMLTAALLRADPFEGSLLMLAFGVGTTPMMLLLSQTGSRLSRLNSSRMAASVVAGIGLFTLLMPWLGARPELHDLLKGLGCLS